MKVIHIYTVFVISRYTTSFVGLICNLYGEVCEIIVFVFFFSSFVLPRVTLHAVAMEKHSSSPKSDALQWILFFKYYH